MMKVFLILAFVCFAWAAEISYPTAPVSEFDCSQVEDPTIDRFYLSNDVNNNLTLCNYFYRCVPSHPLAYRYICNDVREVFSENMQMCVNTFQAYKPCGTLDPTVEPPPTEATPSPPTGTNEPPTTQAPAPPFYCDGIPDGIYASPYYCNQFYYCNGDVKPGTASKPVTCPSGLVFNPVPQYCDYPENLNPPCTDSMIARYDDVDTTGPACDESERYECNGAIEIVADEDCVTFYNCDAQIQRPCPSKCPPPLVFNQDKNVCDWAEDVAPPCGTNTTAAAFKKYDVTGPACEDSERYECNGAIEIVVDEDCVTYYNCDANIQRVCPSKCPPGLVFNKAAGYCDFMYNVAPPCGTASA